MPSYSHRALELKYSLEAGVISASEVIAWADQAIASLPVYEDSLTELAITSDTSPKNLTILLGRLVDDADHWKALRAAMSRMYFSLRSDSSVARDITRFLESFWSQHDYDTPDDLNFISGIDDEYSLAEQGIYGTTDEAYLSLLTHLSKFAKDTEQGAAANP